MTMRERFYELATEALRENERVAVVLEHGVAGAPQHDVGEAVGGLLDQVLGVGPRHTEVDVSEKGEKQRRARDHTDRELGRQAEPEFPG